MFVAQAARLPTGSTNWLRPRSLMSKMWRTEGAPQFVFVRVAGRHGALPGGIGIAAHGERAAVEHFIERFLGAQGVPHDDVVDASPLPVLGIGPQFGAQPLDAFLQAVFQQYLPPASVLHPPGIRIVEHLEQRLSVVAVELVIREQHGVESAPKQHITGVLVQLSLH